MCIRDRPHCARKGATAPSWAAPSFRSSSATRGWALFIWTPWRCLPETRSSRSAKRPSASTEARPTPPLFTPRPCSAANRKMCIRDRRPAQQEGSIAPSAPFRRDRAAENFPCPKCQRTDDGPIPVSYTHLDVYKRQPFPCHGQGALGGNKGSPAACRAAKPSRPLVSGGAGECPQMCIRDRPIPTPSSIKNHSPAFDKVE